MRQSRHHQDKLEEALELLNEAAREKKEELQEAVEGRYSDLKDLLIEQAENGLSMLNHAKKRIAKTLQQEEEKILTRAKDLDRTVRRNPWPVVGGAAVSALLLGVILGRK